MVHVHVQPCRLSWSPPYNRTVHIHTPHVLQLVSKGPFYRRVSLYFRESLTTLAENFFKSIVIIIYVISPMV